MTAHDTTKERWAVVREIFEECHEPGAELDYRSIRLTKPAWICDESTVWQLYGAEGGYLDSIRVAAFRSARELEEYLDDVSERQAMARAETADHEHLWTAM